jgi:hypothetical protein
LHDCATGRALAASTLTDDAERLTPHHIEADARHGVHFESGTTDGKLDDQIFDAQERFTVA